jgi:hypothetical protein
VQQGESVSITGSASDPDGTIVGWSWTRISGTAVSLSGANTPTVQFTAPNSAGDIRLRLTVTDDGGATDSDDVIITVEAAPDPGNTTGSTLQSMLDDINAARGQERNCGSTPYPSAPPLQWSSSLANIAMQHSMDMAQNGYFSHTSLDGTTLGDASSLLERQPDRREHLRLVDRPPGRLRGQQVAGKPGSLRPADGPGLHPRRRRQGPRPGQRLHLQVLLDDGPRRLGGQKI